MFVLCVCGFKLEIVFIYLSAFAVGPSSLLAVVGDDSDNDDDNDDSCAAVDAVDVSIGSTIDSDGVAATTRECQML